MVQSDITLLIYIWVCNCGLNECVKQMCMYVTVGTEEPLAGLKVVRRLSVDKGQVLQSVNISFI